MAPGTVSLTGDGARCDDSKQISYYRYIQICWGFFTEDTQMDIQTLKDVNNSRGMANAHSIIYKHHLNTTIMACNFNPLKPHFYMSAVVRKPAFYICENKDADQLRGKREDDQRLCFRYIESKIQIRNSKPLAIFYDCTAQFVSDMVENTRDRFSHDAAHIVKQGFTSVITYIICLICALKHYQYLLELPEEGGPNEYTLSLF